MSDSDTPPDSTASAPVQAKPTPGEEWRSMSPEAFKARLAEERAAGERATLKKLGVDKTEDAKARIEQAVKLEQERMSEQEKLQARISDLEPRAKAAEAYRLELEEQAKAAFESLPPSLQNMIAATAGDDHLARAKAIRAAQASGVLSAFSTPSPVEAPKVPSPATTVAPGGPSPTVMASEKTAYDKWVDLKAKSPVLAAQFYSRNARAIESTKK